MSEGSSLDGTIGAWQNLIENNRLLLQMLLCKIMIKVNIFPQEVYQVKCIRWKLGQEKGSW